MGACPSVDLDENSFKKQTSVHANNERKGPPFRLAFPSTVYKAQGHTLLRAIGDLKGMIASYNHRHQLYVMLSRVKKGDYILLGGRRGLPGRVEAPGVFQGI
eukprot:tig00000764_g3992.t1